MIDKKLKEAKDYVRFNAKKLTDIHPLLVEVIADTFDLIVDIPEFKNGNFRLSQVGNYHSAPIGKRTNWGGIDTNYPTEFVGWNIYNTRGTFRTKDGREITDRWIQQQKIKSYDTLESKSFWTTALLNWNNGINTGTFNGGSDFMGCFRFFIEDYPHICNNIASLFHKDDIIRVFDIDDWNSYIRNEKLKKLNLYNGK